MTITANSGPVLSFGTVMTSSAGTGLLGADMERNEQRAPSLFDLGVALMDPRVAYQYEPGSGVTSPVFGFYNSVGYVDFVPATRSDSSGTASLVRSSLTNVAAGAAFSLTPASSALGTYATTIIAPENGRTSETLIAIDSTAASVTFGSAGSVAMWNPGAGTGRCVSITTSSSGDAGTFTIIGRDMYGYKMTESVTANTGTSNSSGYTVRSQKAFKYVSSIINTTTTTSTSIYAGFSDTFGFPLLTTYLGMNAELRLMPTAYSSVTYVALASSAQVVLGQSSIATQTSTTPDVRGTYASTTASNGTLRLQMRITPVASAVATVTSTNVAPLFGAAQFSSV